MTVDGRSTRWEQHRQERRRELVEAALRAIRAHGAGVGIEEIAATAGTSKTVIYRHFTDRSGLYAAVSDRVDALILRDLTAALGSRGTTLTELSADARDVIAAAIDAYLRLVERDPEVYRFIVSAPMLDRHERPDAADPAAPVTAHVASELEALIADALSRTGQDAGAAPTWAAGLVGMVRAAADHWLQSPAGTRPDRTTLAHQLTELAWSGLGPAWTGTTAREETR